MFVLLVGYVLALLILTTCNNTSSPFLFPPLTPTPFPCLPTVVQL